MSNTDPSSINNYCHRTTNRQLLKPDDSEATSAVISNVFLLWCLRGSWRFSLEGHHHAPGLCCRPVVSNLRPGEIIVLEAYWLWSYLICWASVVGKLIANMPASSYSSPGLAGRLYKLVAVSQSLSLPGLPPVWFCCVYFSFPLSSVK